MTDKEKLEKLMKLADAMYYAAQYLTTNASRLHKAMDEYHKFIIHEWREESVSNPIDFEKELYKAFGQVKDFTLGMQIAKRFYNMGKNSQEPVSDDLGEYINELSKQFPEASFAKLSRIAVRVAKWQKEHLWKPADGDDLPEYDREVIVLINYNAQLNIHDEEYPTYRVGFGHRPNPDGWDGKNIDTNEVTHYTPKLYDKGGWNAPNIVYWLDARLPYEENKIDKEIEL